VKVAASDGHPRRIAVVGTSGSGKTTLAYQLAQQMGIPHVELDALHWGPNWTRAPRQVFREHTAKALTRDAWTTDGNYSAIRDIVWNRADTVVWLDYALPVILWRVARRTIRRFVMREELWNKNHKRFRDAFLSYDSSILWAVRTYRRRRREYPILFSEPEYAHLSIVQLRSPRAARLWLANLPATDNK
jgi:adenylate kinase family enzyme